MLSLFRSVVKYGDLILEAGLFLARGCDKSFAEFWIVVLLV